MTICNKLVGGKKRKGFYYTGPRPERSGVNNPKFKHGHAHSNGDGHSATYRSWYSMLRRCDPNNKNAAIRRTYSGITVCDRWRSFENFLADVGERPDGKTLDRIDGTKGYGPENCRWANIYEQARNMKSTKLTYAKAVEAVLLCFEGVTRADVGRKFGCKGENISHIMCGRAWPDAYASAKVLFLEGNG